MESGGVFPDYFTKQYIIALLSCMSSRISGVFLNFTASCCLPLNINDESLIVGDRPKAKCNLESQFGLYQFIWYVCTAKVSGEGAEFSRYNWPEIDWFVCIKIHYVVIKCFKQKNVAALSRLHLFSVYGFSFLLQVFIQLRSGFDLVCV